MKRLLWPAAWTLRAVGRFGYALNQIFIPRYVKLSRWIRK
jgi:hypothetical protein